MTYKTNTIKPDFLSDDKQVKRAKRRLLQTFEHLEKYRRTSGSTYDTFMRVLFGEIHDILVEIPMYNVSQDRYFWEIALWKIHPYIALRWSDVDPLVSGCLFDLFVTEFVFILSLWEQSEFSDEFTDQSAKAAVSILKYDDVFIDKVSDILTEWFAASSFEFPEMPENAAV